MGGELGPRSVLEAKQADKQNQINVHTKNKPICTFNITTNT